MNNKKEMAVLVLTLFLVIGLHSVKQNAITFRGTSIKNSLAMLPMPLQSQSLVVEKIDQDIKADPNFTSNNIPESPFESLCDLQIISHRQ